MDGDKPALPAEVMRTNGETAQNGGSLSTVSAKELLLEGGTRVSAHAAYVFNTAFAAALCYIGLEWGGGDHLRLLGVGSVAGGLALAGEFAKHLSQKVRAGELKAAQDGARTALEEKAAAESALAVAEDELVYLREFVTQWGPDVMTTQLRNHAERLGFEKHHRTRLSFYFAHDPQRDHLILLGRYSNDPMKMKDPTRIYPVSEGCIGVAWREGRSVPEEVSPYDRDPEAWCAAQCEKLRFPADKAATLRMKSIGYAAFRIESVDERLGVLVVESTEPGAVSAYLKKLEKEMKPENQTIARELVRFVLHVRRYLGDPNLARSLDF